MKVRLYKGPFNGKVIDFTGGSTLIYRDNKRMTRAQWRKMLVDRVTDNLNYYRDYINPPQVEARYEQMHLNGRPWYHPDGSVFYRYVEGSKREL